MERREFFGIAALVLLPSCVAGTSGRIEMEEAYGVIGQMKTAPGKRADVVAAMIEGTRNMPGNIAYLIAEDLGDPDSLWITEIWESREAHSASLQLPQVQAAIGKARPHIAGFGTRVETRPVMRAG